MLAAVFWASTYLGAIHISDFPLAENPENVAGVLLAVTFVLTRFPRFQFWSGPARYFLAYFAVSAALSVGRYLSGWPGAELRIFAQYAQVFLLYLIFFDLCQDTRAVQVLVGTFMVTTVLLSVIANLGLGGLVGATAAGRGGVTERVGVLGMNLNYQAFLYAVAITTILCRALARWPRFGKLDWGLVAGAVSMLLALLQTGSRGGLLTLTAGVAVTLLLMFRGRRWAAYALLVPLVLYGIGSAIMRSEVIRARVENTLYGRDYGARDVLAEEAFAMLKERPFVGWGTTYIQELGTRTGKLQIAAHNTYLQVASAFGLAGLIPWLAGLASTGWRLWRHRRQFFAGALLAILCALLVGMVPSNYAYGRFKWIFLALAGAMPFGPLPTKHLRPGAAAAPREAGRGHRPGRPALQRGGAGLVR